MAYPYATVANVKVRLGVTVTTIDAVLASLCEQANTGIESITYRAIGSNSGTYLFDGYDALEGGRMLYVKDGVRTISSLEVASYTGDSFVTVPSTDHFIRPLAHHRQPGWPGFEIWMTDIPAASNTLPVFLPGFENIRVTVSAGGWAEMPGNLRGAAERTVVRAYQGRQSGETDEQGNADIGVSLIERYMHIDDLHIVKSYRWQNVEII